MVLALTGEFTLFLCETVYQICQGFVKEDKL